MRHVLLYEPHHEQVPHLVFLLTLARMHCTHARTAEEAMNWLAAANLQVVFFDLVLIGSLDRQSMEPRLLRHLTEIELPVVFFQRDEENPMPDLCSYPNPIICRSDDLLSCLDNCFNSETID